MWSRVNLYFPSSLRIQTVMLFLSLYFTFLVRSTYEVLYKLIWAITTSTDIGYNVPKLTRNNSKRVFRIDP